MTHQERAALALQGKVPDYIPTFELEYQIVDKTFGKPWLTSEELEGLTEKEAEQKLEENARYLIEVYSALEHSIIPIHFGKLEHICKTARLIRQISGNEFMLTAHGDGTFSIPDGNDMYGFAYRIADDPDGLKAEAEKQANDAIERNTKLADAGVDSVILCADYCYNSGPFLSPAMFSEYIAPYLAKIIEASRKNGQYTIKHTDGNIMPILDILVECGPDAIHSLDPMAGVDMKTVKTLVGDKVALCGNVNCALLQTGTPEEIRESAEYAIQYGKPGGGYIYCTSNVPFTGMPPESYALVLDVWRELRKY